MNLCWQWTALLLTIEIITNKSTRESKNLRQRQKFKSKVIRDANPDFRINPHPDVCRICPEILWILAAIISPSMVQIVR